MDSTPSETSSKLAPNAVPRQFDTPAKVRPMRPAIRRIEPRGMFMERAAVLSTTAPR